jgi:hypothetical protein
MKFSPFLFIKACLLLFTAVGVALLVFLIRMDIDTFMGYLISGAFIVVPVFLYLCFFTNIRLQFSNSSTTPPDTITYDALGFYVVEPRWNRNKYIAWDTIESIIYQDRPKIEDSFSTRFHITLNRPVAIIPTGAPFFLDRIFGVPGAKALYIYIADDNYGFNTLQKGIQEHLNPDADFSDSRKGRLINETRTTNGSTTQTTQQWEPRTGSSGHRIIYERKEVRNNS